MEKTKGYTKKILIIDLKEKETDVETIPEEWLEDYIGGEGLAARYFYEHYSPEKDPLDPEQPIIFATGPLTGTSAPSSGRWCIVFRSPLTGTIGASNCGGKFAPQIKKAGYDLILIKGKASEPTYLFIKDDKVEFRDASDIWGKGVEKTDKEIIDGLENSAKDAQIASIGPAGENKVLYAAVMNDGHRAAGRGGAGAVMGSKGLKAVVIKGSKEIEVADPKALKKKAKESREELFSEDFVREELSEYGTPSFYAAIDDLGLLPTKNWQKTTYPTARNRLDHNAYYDILEVEKYACWGCPIACGTVTEVKDGKYKGSRGGGPEYETVAAFGSKTLVKDMNAIAAASHLANDMGLDHISAGQAIATAMEWYDKGLIDREDTGGIGLEWGNADAVVELTSKISRREGFGDLLADGVQKAAEKLGEDAFEAAMHVKGMEMAADGVRASKGEAVVHAVSPRGADHLRPWAPTVDAFGYREEELGIEGDIDFKEDDNKWWIKPFQELCMATNMLGVCLFTVITIANKPSTYAEMLSLATGKEYTKEELLEAAERVINLERIINVELGFDKEDDTLPKRFLNEPAPDGRGKGEVVGLEEALMSYYEAMGWDMNTGKPKDETLERLGLDRLN